MSDFSRHCEKIAEHFLQTAIVVDDGAHIAVKTPSHTSLVKPDRHTLSKRDKQGTERDELDRQSLDARVIVDSFAEKGMICGIIAPMSSNGIVENVGRAAKCADIVILDWHLDGDNGQEALSILKSILDDDADGRLRLVAIYTGESDIRRIGQTIKNELHKGGREFENKNNQDVVLSHQHCRIVIYAKPDTQLIQDLRDRSITEADLPKVLIRDFASMTQGLLPNIALTSLAAIRNNAHKVLDKFEANLDPAFLTHRACLPSPDDSQQHMVNHLASELHSIIDDAVVKESPADLEAIEKWLTKNPDCREYVFGENKKMSVDQTIELLKEGLKQKPGPLSRSNDFRILSSGFTGTDDGEKLDLRLAWLMNFRTIFDAPAPRLHLGTALRKDTGGESSDFFLCMRPRCDSVRLDGEEAFLLLPLIEPKPKTIQLVLQENDNTYRRVSICTSMTQWSLRKFLPNNKGFVIAEKAEESFLFKDVEKTQFYWLGELKSEFTQRVAQEFASELSRVAIDNSEWLRRSER
ncbi:MAG: response regulator receiver domain [Nitrospira sp.]|nr:response regulator receiver domain [Nitrospira sp.]